MKRVLAVSLLSMVVFGCTNQDQTKLVSIASAPAGDRYTSINKDGETVIPNGRLITPSGKQIFVAPHPFGLTLSPDGKTIIAANSGVGPFSISIISDFNSSSPNVKQIPETQDSEKGLLEAVFMGLAVSPDGKKIYVAGGQQNLIYIFDLTTNKKLGEINCNKSFDNNDYNDGYIGDMVMNKDGSRLYAIDQIGFRMMIVDTKTNQVIQNVKTGRYPFGIALSPDEKTVYVANVGMFEYSYIKSLDKKRLKETAAKFPVSAYGSKEMKEGVKNDSIEFEGLGDPNAPESFSVWGIDVTKPKPEVISKVKTGVLVGEEIEGISAVGGSSPNSMVATENFVYVSNGNNDNISVIDVKQNKVVESIDLKLDDRLGNLRGVIPFGLTLSPDRKRLYVAEAGINAVGVIDVGRKRTLGHIPTGWFPSKLKVTPDGRQLIVANAKGFGSGPNGGKDFKPLSESPHASYVGVLMRGTVSVIDLPSDDQLPTLTQKVISNNFSFQEAKSNSNNPIPLYPKESESLIKYIVFISKENRTYDEVFGQVNNSEGDTSLARFGKNVSFSDQHKKLKVDNADVMPNHLALANRFTISDNFYVDADVSADGHVWLTNTYPNQWMETHHPAAYGGKRNQKQDSKAPGKFGMTGSAGAIFPESYNEAGSMWEHLNRNDKEFYNFGFGVEFDPGSFADSTFKYGGIRYLVNYPLPGPLYDRTSRMFPTFNMAIPDQFRADVFIQEIREKFLDVKKDLPSMLTLQLPNDHGTRERAYAAYPFFESYMSDNDLALGRVVEFLSHTPQWKNMMIVVTEDDAQGGRDHVDAHRSILMVISPYAKKNFVSHRHASFGSIFKTFWNVLGIPYLNQYDFGASDLGNCFSDEPDFTPYDALPVDKRVFDPVKALTPLNEKFDWEAFRESPEMDDPEDMKKGDDRMKVNH
ncbi:MAG TPA: bifunctional YncE family protein/alkaline phosphatase family protein [Cyclobacteriaceae bacterium]|jgi:YVTN family beta-propeller protein|nr:bifunctional YncE family protein/alkaline phosphatase family protein [Cyclobacteriaceae bacterium]